MKQNSQTLEQMKQEALERIQTQIYEVEKEFLYTLTKKKEFYNNHTNGTYISISSVAEEDILELKKALNVRDINNQYKNITCIFSNKINKLQHQIANLISYEIVTSNATNKEQLTVARNTKYGTMSIIFRDSSIEIVKKFSENQLDCKFDTINLQNNTDKKFEKLFNMLIQTTRRNAKNDFSFNDVKPRILYSMMSGFENILNKRNSIDNHSLYEKVNDICTKIRTNYSDKLIFGSKNSQSTIAPRTSSSTNNGLNTKSCRPITLISHQDILQGNQRSLNKHKNHKNDMLFDPFGDFANNDRPDNSMNNEDPYGLEEAFNELKGEENLSEYLSDSELDDKDPYGLEEALNELEGEENLSEYLSDSELDDKDPYGLEEALNELENGKNSQNYKRNLSSDSESESEEIANNPSTNIQSFNYKKKFIERYELSQK